MTSDGVFIVKVLVAIAVALGALVYSYVYAQAQTQSRARAMRKRERDLFNAQHSGEVKNMMRLAPLLCHYNARVNPADKKRHAPLYMDLRVCCWITVSPRTIKMATKMAVRWALEFCVERHWLLAGALAEYDTAGDLLAGVSRALYRQVHPRNNEATRNIESAPLTVTATQ